MNIEVCYYFLPSLLRKFGRPQLSAPSCCTPLRSPKGPRAPCSPHHCMPLLEISWASMAAVARVHIWVAFRICPCPSLWIAGCWRAPPWGKWASYPQGCCCRWASAAWSWAQKAYWHRISRCRWPGSCPACGHSPSQLPRVASWIKLLTNKTTFYKGKGALKMEWYKLGRIY